MKGSPLTEAAIIETDERPEFATENPSMATGVIQPTDILRNSDYSKTGKIDALGSATWGTILEMRPASGMKIFVHAIILLHEEIAGSPTGDIHELKIFANTTDENSLVKHFYFEDDSSLIDFRYPIILDKANKYIIQIYHSHGSNQNFRVNFIMELIG